MLIIYSFYIQCQLIYVFDNFNYFLFCVLLYFLGSKSQSNLNEIDKSEQKSGDLDRKNNYNWSPEHGKKQ